MSAVVRRSFFSVAALSLLLAVTHPATVAAGPGPAGPPALGPATLAATPLYRLEGETLLRSTYGAGGWEPVSGLPARVLPQDRAGESLPVTAFAVDPANPSRLLVAVGARLFLSSDAARDWTEVDVSEAVNPSTYVTSAAIDLSDPDRWVLGTSYDGLYLTEDGGESWLDVNEEWTIRPLHLGAGFSEEIAGLQFETDGTLLVAAGLGGGFVAVDLGRRTARRLRPVTDGAAYRAPGAPGAPAAPWTASEGSAAAWGTAPDGEAPALTAGERAGSAAASRRELASGRTGIYLAAPNASTERLPGYFDYLERHGFNSVVVDFKDDFGRVTFHTELDMPRRAGAVEPLVDTDTLLRLARERDIYVIARIVVFKDRRLFRYDGYRYALWDSRREAPWGVFRTVTDLESGETRTVQVEHWVDPFSAEVWEYNIAVAEEAAALGVDEIQFDYIRFPSDGNTEAVQSRYAPDGAGRVEALEAFLSAARERLDVPVGIDVFGFNAWSRMSYLGQDISRLSRYVDVISPMFYPSHFARPFLPAHGYLERSRVIYDEGTRRAREIAGGSLIRPYVQAFLIGPELEFEEPEYRRYLDLQLEGAARAAADGYTLWNASGRYYMLP